MALQRRPDGRACDALDSVTETVAESNPDPVVEEPPWDPPAGFGRWKGSDNVAWRWVEDAACRGDYCWQVEVVTRDGCADGLYVSLNLLKGETVIDYTNDRLNAIEPEQVARLTLSEYGDHGAVTGRITEISCY